jgi:hypothetical protein
MVLLPSKKHCSSCLGDIVAEKMKKKAQNPLLMERFPSFFGKAKSLPSLDMIKRPKKLEVYLRPEASWRRMLVQQPPVLVIGLLKTVPDLPDTRDSHEFYEIHVSSLSCYLIVLHSVL